MLMTDEERWKVKTRCCFLAHVMRLNLISILVC